ncbi:MAG: MBL fold metallo-hydrolase [Deltaproteobacteria bacterium]|nr:MBL fold metallo-hydrolase [Deltaproteobacteria bacterium]
MNQENKTVNITWLGTAGVLIADGDCGILIDPYVSRFGLFKIALGIPLQPDKESIKRWTARLEEKNIRAVVVSHSHFDHCLDAPYFAQETGALLIGSESTINVGRGSGLAEKYMQTANSGRTINIGAFSLKFIESIHGPAFLGRIPYPGTIDKPLTAPRPARDYRLGQTYAILISHPTGTIVHHGSAGFMPGMYKEVKADVVLLGIAGRGDTETYLKNVPLALGVKMIIPIHFDNFFVRLDKKMKNLPGLKLKEFLAEAEKHRQSFELKTLSIGEKTAILPLKAKENSF